MSRSTATRSAWSNAVLMEIRSSAARADRTGTPPSSARRRSTSNNGANSGPDARGSKLVIVPIPHPTAVSAGGLQRAALAENPVVTQINTRSRPGPRAARPPPRRGRRPPPRPPACVAIRYDTRTEPKNGTSSSEIHDLRKPHSRGILPHDQRELGRVPQGFSQCPSLGDSAHVQAISPRTSAQLAPLNTLCNVLASSLPPPAAAPPPPPPAGGWGGGAAGG